MTGPDPLAKIRAAILDLRRRMPSVRSATVTSINPLRIHLDGEPAPVAATPVTLTSVGPGDRVRVLHYGTTHLILGVIGGSGTMLLDEISLSGSSGDSAEHRLHVPAGMYGRFRKYTIDVMGSTDAVDSAGVRPLVIRVNNDAADGYRAVAVASTGAASSLDGTSFPRTAFMGLFQSTASITFIPSRAGSTGYVSWHSTGWCNSGASDSFLFNGGGRWSGTEQQIEFFQVMTNLSSSQWRGGSHARLWGHR